MRWSFEMGTEVESDKMLLILFFELDKDFESQIEVAS